MRQTLFWQDSAALGSRKFGVDTLRGRWTQEAANRSLFFCRVPGSGADCQSVRRSSSLSLSRGLGTRNQCRPKPIPAIVPTPGLAGALRPSISKSTGSSVLSKGSAGVMNPDKLNGYGGFCAAAGRQIAARVRFRLRLPGRRRSDVDRAGTCQARIFTPGLPRDVTIPKTRHAR